MLGRPGVFAAVLGDCGEQDTFREVLTKRYPQLRSTQSLTSGREPRMPKLNHLRLAAYTTTRPIPTSSPPPAHAPSNSGQVSVDEEGRIVGEGDLAAQTTQVMQNLGLALKAAGATYANIVKITTFVVNYKPELRPIIGKARSAFFEGMEPPASTLVGVSALAAPEWLIEIEAIAVAD